MIFSFAPLEGVTDGVYRRAHAAVYGGADRYFTPFYSPSEIGLSKKDLAALDADDRDATIPQLLTRRAGDFLSAAANLHALGYRVVNLNFGCPSGTVSAKHKGAGFLLDKKGMRDFFDAIFDGLSQVAPHMQLSLKTRIGYRDECEFAEILSIYNNYPFCELIIHPRLRQDFYRGKPRMATYTYAEGHTKIPLCYNGNIFAAEDYAALLQEKNAISRVMIGRGAVANPALFLILRGEQADHLCVRLREMHDRILEENCRRMGVGRNLLCRMAELWNYQIFLFEHAENAIHRIHRAANLAEYRAAVAALFREYHFLPFGAYCPPGST